MLQSVITSKGQTTIPKKIRELLDLRPKDRLYYIVEGNRVILKPLRGDILELRGSVSEKGIPLDFHEVRAATKKKVARSIAEEK